MKTIFTLLLAFLFFLCACKNGISGHDRASVKDTSTVLVLNGKNKLDTANYTCLNCAKYLNDTGVFHTVIAEASMQAKQSLKNPLSFIPISMDIIVGKADSLFYVTGKKVDSCFTIVVDYKCIGKNAYGTENEVNTSSLIYLVNNKITDLNGKLKKEALAFTNEGYINRSLHLYDNSESLTLQPVKSGGSIYLAVTSSESCVDKGARLSITFDNDEKITMTSWNDFNCKSNSYYTLKASDLEKLKANKIKYVSFSDSETIFCSVPENNNDYLIQFANLVSK